MVSKLRLRVSHHGIPARIRPLDAPTDKPAAKSKKKQERQTRRPRGR